MDPNVICVSSTQTGVSSFTFSDMQTAAKKSWPKLDDWKNRETDSSRAFARSAGFALSSRIWRSKRGHIRAMPVTIARIWDVDSVFVANG